MPDAPHNALAWFEIPVDDFERARMFYGRIFEYDMKIVDRGPARLGMLPFVPGPAHAGGAIVKREDFLPARHGALVYLQGGDDLTPVLMRVEDAGGKVLVGKTPIGGDLGFFATFLDSEGNKVGLHSPH